MTKLMNLATRTRHLRKLSIDAESKYFENICLHVSVLHGLAPILNSQFFNTEFVND